VCRVFGYKEIYSSLVRKPQSHAEIISHGVEFTRLLFPRSKFIFHWRQNVSRIANSDFWQKEDALSAAQDRFGSLISRFSRYAAAHPDYSFATTLEGVTDKSNQSQLEALFRFLDEPLTPRLRKMAYGRGGLQDWTEERHKRRIKRTLSNGTVVVDAVEYAWRPGKVEAAAAKSADALRSELEKRAADAEAAALAARAAAQHAGTLAAKQLTELQAQCSNLQSSLTQERALAASRAETRAVEVASALMAQRTGIEATEKQRNGMLAKLSARVEELDGAVRASQVPGTHGSTGRVQQSTKAVANVSHGR